MGSPAKRNVSACSVNAVLISESDGQPVSSLLIVNIKKQ